MLRIRLRRVGKRGQPSYRIVVADSRVARDGAIVEQVGTYNPRTDPPSFTLDKERAAHWVKRGARPSEAVERILRKGGLTQDGGEHIGDQTATPERPAENAGAH